MSADSAEVLVISHVDESDVVWVNQLIRDAGMEPRHVKPFAGEQLPDPLSVAATICLGGPQSAYDYAGSPFLHQERQFLRRAVDAGVPVLGICLGSQILAESLGGKALGGTHGLECGFIDVTASSSALHCEDEWLQGRYFSFHTDTFRLPLGAKLLASSEKYPQVWRLGSALAIQFHPEISPAGIEQIFAVEGEKLRANGVDVNSLLAEAESARDTAWAGSQRIIGGWLMNNIRV